MQSSEVSYSHEAHPTALSLSPELMDVLFPEGFPSGDSGAGTPLSVSSPRPVGGTVSHHLLAADEIDRWFRNLVAYGDIDTFIIISPAHWTLDGSVLKITDLPWDAGFAMMDCDSDTAVFLSESAPLGYEPEAFHMEHGIDSLIPYIAAYFPESRVVPILQREENIDTAGLGELATAIRKLVVSNPRTRYFLMVSADFSHHAGIEVTAERDARTEAALPVLSRDQLPHLYSDNRGGLLVLSDILEDGPEDYRLIGHTNSYRISGMDEDDITSYFFTLYW